MTKLIRNPQSEIVALPGGVHWGSRAGEFGARVFCLFLPAGGPPVCGRAVGDP